MGQSIWVMFLEPGSLIAGINHSYFSERKTAALLVSVPGNHELHLRCPYALFLRSEVRKLEEKKKKQER